MKVLLGLLIAQGILGALDVLINHEWREDLPGRPGAMVEEAIHGLREVFYAVVFAGLAWFEWQGAWALVFGGVLVIEVLLTAWDFVEEDKTRVLSATERVMHLFLSMGGGAYCALLIPVLIEWSAGTNALIVVDHGWLSRVLSVMAVGVLFWGIRDLHAAGKLYTQHYARRLAS